MYLAWSMNYFHINIENREKAMPLIFKPLGLEVLLVFFLFLSFFFLISLKFSFVGFFLFFWFFFLFSDYFVLVFWSRCLRFNLLQGQILTVGELTLQYKKYLHALVGPWWWSCVLPCLHFSPRPPLILCWKVCPFSLSVRVYHDAIIWGQT